MGRRTILLIAALVVAALGTALVFMYANRADERAQAGAAQVEVLVATAGIATGTTGAAVAESGTVELRTLPAASVPPGALSDLTPVTDLITISTIFPGQVLIQPMFGTQAQTSGGLTLPEGKVAVAITLGDPQRVAGFVNPGSEVAIFRTGIPPVTAGATERTPQRPRPRPTSCSTGSRSSPSAPPRSAPPPPPMARPPTRRPSPPRS